VIRPTPKLTVVLSNPSPNREQRYPCTWLLYAAGSVIFRVHVAHDGKGRPQVVDKTAS